MTTESLVLTLLKRWFNTHETIEADDGDCFVLYRSDEHHVLEEFIERNGFELMNSTVNEVVGFEIPDVVYMKDGVMLVPCSDIEYGEAHFLKLSRKGKNGEDKKETK